MNKDLSWMLDSLLEIPGALHAVLFSGDGLQMARSKLADRDMGDTVAAAASSVQSLSRSLGFFCKGSPQQWRQTLVEFECGWVFLNPAGEGAYLAVAADQSVDMGDITYRVQKLVDALGKELTAPPRQNAGAQT